MCASTTTDDFFIIIWFFTSHQQYFGYIGMGLPGLNQYKARIIVSCSRTTKAVTPVRLEPMAHQSHVQHSTTEPLRSFNNHCWDSRENQACLSLGFLPMSSCLPMLSIKISCLCILWFKIKVYLITKQNYQTNSADQYQTSPKREAVWSRPSLFDFLCSKYFHKMTDLISIRIIVEKH